MAYIRVFTATLILALTWLFPAQASATPVAHGMTVRSERDIDRVMLRLSQEVPHKSFMLENPLRLVIDLPSIDWKAGQGLPAGYQGDILRNIRVARFNATTTRIVFDLAQPARLDEVILRPEGAGQPVLMVFDVAARHYISGSKSADIRWQEGRAAPVTPAASPPAAADWGTLAEVVSRPAPLPADLPFETIPVPVPRPAAAYRPVVVIDAGHGGRDPGAIGARGTHEKNVTLAYAKALRDALEATGRYRVSLTRTDDTYIMLRERLALARKADGDIFISLHADSAENKNTRGFSIYTLSDTASDKEAAALATRENKVDLIYGLNLSSEHQDVTEILIDLAQRETKKKSLRLADTLVKYVGKKVQLLPNTHRYAGFAVLKAPDVPSVLIEIGFLSNRKDEALITSSNYRSEVVAALVNGIDAYFKQAN